MRRLFDTSEFRHLSLPLSSLKSLLELPREPKEEESEVTFSRKKERWSVLHRLFASLSLSSPDPLSQHD